MANVIINDSNLTAIGNAIRAKNGTETLYKPREMAAAIEAIEVGGGSGDVENDAVRQSYIDLMRSADSGSVTITIPKEAEFIPTQGFVGIKSMGAVVLENHSAPNLTIINDNAFQNCTYLKSIEWPENLDYIGQQAFTNCSELEVSEFPETLTVIKPYAFQKCKKVTISEWPTNVTIVNNCVFQECTGLQLTSLPEGVTKIGGSAFEKACDTSVSRELFTIPSTVTDVGNYAFRYQNFKKIRFMGTPSTISSSAFSNSDVTDLYVPWTHSGVVANSPYGALNATIHYNTSPDEVIE